MSHIVWPERATEEAAAYFKATRRILDLFHLIIDSVISNDFVAYTAKKALDQVDSENGEKIFERGPDDKVVSKITPADLAQSNPGPRTKALRQSAQELLELFLARSVDSFETYIVSIIRAVLRKQPRILSDSKHDLDIKTILDHSSIDSLVYDLAERKVSGLSYSGFEDLQSWCNTHGIALTVPAGKRDEVIELIATRNVIAHNRGVIDQKYLGIVKAPRFKADERRTLHSYELFTAIGLLCQIIEAAHGAVASKFGLEMLPLEGLDQTQQC